MNEFHIIAFNISPDNDGERNSNLKKLDNFDRWQGIEVYINDGM